MIRTGDWSCASRARILVAFLLSVVTKWVFIKVILKYHLVECKPAKVKAALH